MRKVLYTKYNSTRKPEYQISTAIIEEDNKKYVVKKAMQPVADEYLQKIADNLDKVRDLYQNICFVENRKEENSIVFPYVEGTSLVKKIDLKNVNIDVLVEELKIILEKITNYRDEFVTSFELTEEFMNFFEDCYPFSESAVKAANIGSLFDCFVETNDGEIVCTNYDWVLDFPVPVRYVTYRCLWYFYYENSKYLGRKISIEDFLYKFGFSLADLEVFFKMENAFLQNVYGKHKEYVYIENYRKSVTTYSDLQANTEKVHSLETEIELTRNHANNLQGMVDHLNQNVSSLNIQLNEQELYIQKIKRAIKNPIYGLYLCAKKIKHKIDKKKEEKKLKLEAEKECAYFEKNMGLMPIEEKDYGKIITRLETLESSKEIFSYNPKITIIIPMICDNLESDLAVSIKSVLEQGYSNWELCVVVEQSMGDVSKKIRAEYPNVIVSENLNDLIENASGEFVGFVDCGDVLKSNALYEIVKILNENAEFDFIYSDEDKIDSDTANRHMPSFKPNWSPDTLMSYMYTHQFAVYRKSVLDKIGGLREDVKDAKYYDLVLRFTEETNQIAHIDKILYHNREDKRETTDTEYLDAIKHVKLDAIKRRGLHAELELVEETSMYRVNYISKTNPLISIIIPSKDNFEILERCIKTLVTITEYKNYEIILVDNGSNEVNYTKYAGLSKKYKINYIYDKMEFNFSRMCNVGASMANGEYYLFLNDDIEIIDGKWLSRMIGHAELDHVGAVGAKLLYPGGNKIQHLGVVQLECGPGHAFAGFDDENVFYMARNKVEYNWLAVTAACILVSKKKFQQVNGFAEEFAVTYNDVDFCYKLVEAGYYNVVRTDAVLYHHESVSRGNDVIDEAKLNRMMREQEALYKKHPLFDKKDPFYSRNLEQRYLNFSYNGRMTFDALKSPVECKDDFEENEKLICRIDAMTDANTVYMDGWAFVTEGEDNSNIDFQVLLKGEDRCYLVETAKLYRPDIAKAFPNYKYIEFAGFICKFDKQFIQNGQYQIAIAYKNQYQLTEKILYKE